jgi:hypothetical protein
LRELQEPESSAIPVGQSREVPFRSSGNSGSSFDVEYQSANLECVEAAIGLAASIRCRVQPFERLEKPCVKVPEEVGVGGR